MASRVYPCQPESYELQGGSERHGHSSEVRPTYPPSPRNRQIATYARPTPPVTHRQTLQALFHASPTPFNTPPTHHYTLPALFRVSPHPPMSSQHPQHVASHSRRRRASAMCGVFPCPPPRHAPAICYVLRATDPPPNRLILRSYVRPTPNVARWVHTACHVFCPAPLHTMTLPRQGTDCRLLW